MCGFCETGSGCLCWCVVYMVQLVVVVALHTEFFFNRKPYCSRYCYFLANFHLFGVPTVRDCLSFREIRPNGLFWKMFVMSFAL